MDEGPGEESDSNTVRWNLRQGLTDCGTTYNQLE